MDNADSQIKKAKNGGLQSDTALEEKWDQLKVSPDDYAAEADNDIILKDSVIKVPLLTTQ